MLTASEMDAVCDVLLEHEGLIPWMYCDVKGFVTVGIGDKVNASAVTTMPFVHMSDGRAATTEEKCAAWERTRAFFVPGLKASGYRAVSDLELPAEYCRRRMAMRIRSEFAPAVVRQCPKFESFPLPAKLVLIDICYNVGVGGFAKFRNLIKRCNALDFARAADKVHTKRVGEKLNDVSTWGKRNTWRRNTMLQAADVAS